MRIQILSGFKTDDVGMCRTSAPGFTATWQPGVLPAAIKCEPSDDPRAEVATTFATLVEKLRIFRARLDTDIQEHADEADIGNRATIDEEVRLLREEGVSYTVHLPEERDCPTYGRIESPNVVVDWVIDDVAPCVRVVPRYDDIDARERRAHEARWDLFEAIARCHNALAAC